MTEKTKRLSAKQVQEDLTQKLDTVVENTDKALGEVREDIGGINDKMAEILSALRGPEMIRKTFEPMEQDLGEDHVAEAKEVDDEAVIELPMNANPDSPEFQDKAADLAFMKEPVTVFIHDTSEKNADKVFDVSVNGRSIVFQRSQEYVVPRMFVEGLARAKPVHFENEEYTDASGERGVRWPTRKGLRYGFSVVKDDNPRGKAWLKGVLAQP